MATMVDSSKWLTAQNDWQRKAASLSIVIPCNRDDIAFNRFSKSINSFRRIAAEDAAVVVVAAAVDSDAVAAAAAVCYHTSVEREA